MFRAVFIAICFFLFSTVCDITSADINARGKDRLGGNGNNARKSFSIKIKYFLTFLHITFFRNHSLWPQFGRWTSVVQSQSFWG